MLQTYSECLCVNFCIVLLEYALVYVLVVESGNDLNFGVSLMLQ